MRNQVRMSLPGPIARHWKALIIGLIPVLLVRHHLYCGALVVYNYAFWVVSSSSVSYASPVTVPEVFAEKNIEPPVPRIIHQTWKNKDLPEKWKDAQKSCIAKHPGYEYKLWTDADALAFIKEKFPWFLDTYLSYPHNIQRVDAFRYFVLYEYGGFYIDLDIVCLKSLDFLRHFNFTAPKTYPVGVSNDIMISRPKDPFAHRLIKQLSTWNRWFFVKYATVMFSTGPMFVTIQYTLHDKRDDVTVLPADLYGKYKHTPAAYMQHLHGSSWHSNDANLVFWLERNGLFTLGMVGLIIVATGLGLWVYKWHADTKAKV